MRARERGEDPGRRPEDVAQKLLLFKTFEDSGTGWFWATDAQGNITYLSHSVADVFGQSVDDLLGIPLVNLFHPALSASARERLPFVLNRQVNFDKLTLQSSQTGTQRWWEVSGRLSRNAAGAFDGYLGCCIDVTERLASSESASQLAMFDALTGLPNRLNMAQFLAVHSGPGRRCAVVVLDLDRFKAVNDSLGHPAGDELLTQVANRLVKIIGDREKIFRLGGDEFTIILPNCDDRDTLGELAFKIIELLSQPYSTNGMRCVIGTSVGIAIGPHDGGSGDDLIRKADLALYAAKSSGRGSFKFFSDNLLRIAEDRRVLEEDLRDALARGELSLFYQPQVNANTDQVTGVEALVRWNHPTRGPISPAIFVPIAEEANLIGALGEWTVRKACEDAAGWPCAIRVAVNVSPIQFASDALPTVITSALAYSGLQPSRLELELIEGVFLSESAETDAMFARLKAIGVRLALDDFGTGYSSLGYLRTAPFDKIKIDHSFVCGATLPGSRNGAIIAAIVALAGALDMETTAEGIETIDQLDLMRDLGVGHIQGFLYSKAISSEALCETISDGTWIISPAGPARQRSIRRSMYRKAGVILGGYYHAVIIRNLSETGALIEGFIEVPFGTQVIIDFGDGHLELAVVRRSTDRGHGIEFGEPLVDDGAGNLTTRHVVAPYKLATQGLTGAAQSGESKALDRSGSTTTDALARSLGLSLAQQAVDPHEGKNPNGEDGARDERSHAHHKVRALFAAANPLNNLSLLNLGANSSQRLTAAEWDRLKSAVEESQNPQLKYIIALIVFTGARFQELLTALWTDIDLTEGVWVIPEARSSAPRKIAMPRAAIEILEALPRAAGCGHLIMNPRTNKPYNSVYGSWDAARKKAGLESVSIHDLRKSIKATW